MALHDFILHNGRVVSVSQAGLFAGQLGLLSGWGVFTTLRVRNGRLFAWKRHWDRISRDAALLNVELPRDPDSLESDMIGLIRQNGRPDCTLRLVIVRNTGGMWQGPTADGRTYDIIALTADSKNWGESVRLSVQPYARFAANEFSGAKILSWGQNLTWAERASSAGFDEVVLLNEHGRVSECTSANIFAVQEDQVLTPPLSEGCLGGITRQILLEFDQVREGVLTLEELYRSDEVFITSTTRDLVPVREISGREIRAGRLCSRLKGVFQDILETECRRSDSV